MHVHGYDELLRTGERRFDACCIRMLGYFPYFYLMARMITPEQPHFTVAMVVSLAFSLECCVASSVLSRWRKQSNLRQAPLCILPLALVILVAVPLLGVGAFHLMSPTAIAQAQSVELFCAFLPPGLGFLAVQAFTGRCPHVSRRLAKAADLNVSQRGMPAHPRTIADIRRTHSIP